MIILANNEDAHDNVLISKKDYERLLEDQKWLRCLEGAGVDNWDGFDYAQQIYAERYSKDEKRE